MCEIGFSMAVHHCTGCRLSHLGAKETVDIHKEIGPVIYDIMGKRIFGAEWLQG